VHSHPYALKHAGRRYEWQGDGQECRATVAQGLLDTNRRGLRLSACTWRVRRVLVPNPDGAGEVEATFLAPGEQAEGIEAEIGGVRKVWDVAWISYDDGTTAKVVYADLRSAE
jgi:hypothetical protein